MRDYLSDIDRFASQFNEFHSLLTKQAGDVADDADAHADPALDKLHLPSSAKL